METQPLMSVVCRVQRLEVVQTDFTLTPTDVRVLELQIQHASRAPDLEIVQLGRTMIRPVATVRDFLEAV